MIGKWVLDFMTRPENRTKVLPSLICCPNMEGDGVYSKDLKTRDLWQ